MTTPDLHKLLDGTAQRAQPKDFPPEVAEARRREIARRANAATNLALKALRRLHPEDWKSLKAQAYEVVREAERPPTRRPHMTSTSMANAVADVLAQMLEVLEPVTEAAVGYRATLEAAGYSPMMAEQLATAFHVGMIHVITALIARPQKS